MYEIEFYEDKNGKSEILERNESYDYMERIKK